MKNILILGGTGAMGEHLVSLLSKTQDNNIYVTSRKFHESRDNISYITGNAHDMSFLLSLLKERHWNAIVDFMFSTIAF